MDPDTLGEPEARVTREALTNLWRLAVEATGDACFGLTAIRHATQTTFHALGYSVFASATLLEALERIIRFRRLIGEVLELELERVDDRYLLTIDVSKPPGVPFEAVDAFAAGLVNQARMLLGNRDFHPLIVRFQRPEPPDSSPFHRLFRAPIEFSAAANQIEFEAAAVEARLPSGNAELARHNDAVVVRYLARLGTPRLADRVGHALLELLPDGSPSKETIAKRLAMSPRNLQRQLAEEGTSYKALLNDARQALARDYLHEGKVSVTEIAFLLGFADTATFSRAFKRWTGLSPSDFASRRGKRD
jgi:AraC-like DNA-binding protein